MLPLNKEDFCSLVYRPDLKVKREEDVYGAITCWIGHGYKNRSKHKFDVLQQVRPAIVGAKYIIKDSISVSICYKSLAG